MEKAQSTLLAQVASETLDSGVNDRDKFLIKPVQRGVSGAGGE